MWRPTTPERTIRKGASRARLKNAAVANARKRAWRAEASSKRPRSRWEALPTTDTAYWTTSKPYRRSTVAGKGVPSASPEKAGHEERSNT